MFADLNSTHVFHPEWTLTDMGGIEINCLSREGNAIAFGRCPAIHRAAHENAHLTSSYSLIVVNPAK